MQPELIYRKNRKFCKMNAIDSLNQWLSYFSSFQELDFKNYCRKSQHFTKPSNTKYLLSSIIVHDGASINSGHYRVYCMNQFTKQWLHFNDSRLQVCSSFEELKRQLDSPGDRAFSSPYLLFYSKASDYKK